MVLDTDWNATGPKKIVRLNISQKGLVLVLVPLVFELVFIGTLTYLQRQAEEAAALTQRSRVVVLFVERLNLRLLDVGRNLVLWGVLRQDQFREHMNMAIFEASKQLKELDSLPLSAKSQKENIQRYEKDAVQYLEQMKEMGRQIETEEPLEGRLLRNNLNQQMQKIRNSSLEILKLEEQQKAEYPTKEHSARKLVDLCLFSGVGLNLLACVALAVFYSRDITRRLARMVDNTARLEHGVPLNLPVTGSDEIAQLDRQFHIMAESLTDALKKDKAIFENVAEVILTLGADLTISRISPSVIDVLGWSQEQLEGRKLSDFFLQENVEHLQKVFSSCIDSQAASPLSQEMQMRRSDAEFTWTRWTIVWSRQERSYFCVMHDISAQKEIEQLKNDFTRMISHDLRTPLAAIDLTLELLNNGLYGDLSERGRSRLVTCRTNLKDLLGLINELLDIEKLESGTFEIDPQSSYVSTLISNAVRLVSGLAEINAIKIVTLIDSDKAVHVDSELIVRVIQNLLSNALKFAPKESIITIYAGVLEDMAEIRVKDQGPGLSLEDQKRVFDRFYQAKSDDRATRKKGTGLGLAFCRAIVEQHGGKIAVASEKGHGCEFSFTIPLGKEPLLD